MWIGSRDPKKQPDPGFQTTRKLPARPLPHSETTGLPAQQGQSRHCSVLSETVATVSLSAPLPSHTYDAGQTSVTSRHRPCWAGQSRLLRLAISPWLRVWGAAVRHLPSILRNPWAALTARVISHVHWSPAQTAFTNTHRSTQRPPLDKQRRSATIISTTVICRVTTLASDNWPGGVLWCFRSPPTTTHMADRQGTRRRGWSSPATGGWSNLNVIARCLLYFRKSILAICRRRETRTLA